MQLLVARQEEGKAALAVRIGLMCIAITLCASGSAQAETPTATSANQTAGDLPARLNALIDRTRKQMVFVEGGTFEMGDFGAKKYGKEKLPYSSKPDDDVLHKVTLDSYSIGAYKVTYEDYDVFTDATGRDRISMHEDERAARLPRVPAGINWQQGRDYCQWLGKQVGVPMDLPSEAQWEYAARNRGQLVIYPTDNGEVEDGRNVASFDQIEAHKGKYPEFTRSGPMEVGLYPPTPLGLYDMITNGFEWVLDWYAPAYPTTAQRNPTGPTKGKKRVMRGQELRSGEGLGLVSMTFTRRGVDPAPPPEEYDGKLTGRNQTFGRTSRCVTNHPKPLTQ